MGETLLNMEFMEDGDTFTDVEMKSGILAKLKWFLGNHHQWYSQLFLFSLMWLWTQLDNSLLKSIKHFLKWFLGNHPSMIFPTVPLLSHVIVDLIGQLSPNDFTWMCCLTDTPACEIVVAKIEQKLKLEGDLDFRGLVSDKIAYIGGHWVLLVHANGVSDEQAKVELVWGAMHVHSMLDSKPLLSTMLVNEDTKWCHDKVVVENRAPCYIPLILEPAHTLEMHGEHMIMPTVSRQPAFEQADTRYEADDEDGDDGCCQPEPDKETGPSIEGPGRGGEAPALTDDTDVEMFAGLESDDGKLEAFANEWEVKEAAEAPADEESDSLSDN
jgi:hypothetical protein